MNETENNCPVCGSVLVSTGTAGWCAACLFDTAAADDPAPVGEDSGPLWAGRYRMEGIIGKGGFATVWRAEQVEPVHRQVAVKVLDSGVATPQVLARFEAERQALARMAHPGIAAVYDAGTHEGSAFIVMELVEGNPVTAFCRESGADLRTRMGLFAGLADAVQHAHGRGVIHRDLKPSNLLAFSEAGGPRAKVIDFGVARALEEPLSDSAAPAVTVWRQMIGTPGYISPEQWSRGSAVADARSDVYALGVVLRELLTGKPPEKEGAPGLGGPVLEPIPAARHRELDAIVRRAMAGEPGERYATAAALADDVRHFLKGEPVEAMSRGARYLLGTLVRRHRAAFAGAAAALAAVIGGGAFSAVQYFRADQSAREAAAAQSRAETSEAVMKSALAAADVSAARQLVQQSRAAAALPHLARAARLAPGSSTAVEDMLLLLPQTPLLRIADRWPVPPAGDGPLLAALGCDGTVVSAAGTGLDIRSPGAAEPTTRLALPAPATLVAASDRGDTIAAAIHSSHVLVFTGKKSPPAVTWNCDAEVRVIALPPTGTAVAAGTASGSVWLWDATQPGTPPHVVARGTGAVTRLGLSGAEPAAGFSSGEVWLGEKRLGSLESPVSALSISTSGGVVAAGAASGRVLIHDASTPSPQPQAGSHRGAVSAIALSPDGSVVITAGDDLELHLHRPKNPSAGITTAPLNGRAARLAILPDDPPRLVIHHEDGAVRLWPLSGGPLQPLAPSRGRDALVAASPDGTSALVREGLPAGLQRLELSGAPLPSLRLPGSAGTVLDVSENWIVAADASGLCRRWDLATLTERRLQTPLPTRPLAVRASSDGSAVIALESGACFRGWAQDPALREISAPHPPPSGVWNRAALSPGGRSAAFSRSPLAGDPRQPNTGYLVTDLTTGTSTALGASPPSQALALDARENLASGWSDGRIRVAPHGTRQGQRLDRHTAPVTAIAFDTGGGAMLSGDADGTLLLWLAATPQTVAELPAAVTAVAFSGGSGRFAAAAGSQVHLFDTATRQGLGLPLEAGETVDSLALDAGGSLVAAGLSGGGLRLWHLPPAALSAPAWLPAFAEAWTGQRLASSGQRETLRDPAAPASFHDEVERTRASHPAAAALYDWLTAPPSRRKAGPWSPSGHIP